MDCRGSSFRCVTRTGNRFPRLRRGSEHGVRYLNAADGLNQAPAIDFKRLLVDNCFMSQVSIDEITADLPAFLRRVEAGEELTIMHAGRAVAEIKPISSSPPTARPFGLCAGTFIVPDDFDEPLPEAVLQDFEGHTLAAAD